MNLKPFAMVFVLISLMAKFSLANDSVFAGKDMMEASYSPSIHKYYTVKAHLSPQGLDKLKKLEKHLGKKITIKVADEEKVLTLKAPLQESFEMGPFSADIARKIVQEVNNR